MALDPFLDAAALEGMPEPIRKEYVPVEGKAGRFRLDVRTHEADGERWALENVAGLRSTLEEIRNKRDQAREQLERFKDVDVNEYRRLAAKKAEIEAWDPSSDAATKTRLEEANATWQRKYDTDMTSAKEAAEVASRKYQLYLKTAEAQKAIAKHAPSAVRVLLPHVLPMLDVYGTDDQAQDAVWVRGEGGKPRITQTAGQTGNMTAEELVASLKSDPDFADFFPGTGATGSGAAGSGKGTGASRHAAAAELEKLSPTERLKAARRMQSRT